jgi:peptide/nickel transport system permease protein
VKTYIIRRLLLLVPTLFIVTVIVFLLARFIPGSAVDLIVSQMAYEGGATNVDRAAIEHMLGMDVPIYVQYGRWVGNIFVHGDFGNSLRTMSPIWPDVEKSFPVTLELGIMSIIIGALVSLPIGLLSAIRQDSWADYTARTFSILMISIPSFLLGTLIMILPAKWWGWSPSMELITFMENPLGNLGMFVLPAAIMGFTTSGVTMRVARTQMLEILRQDYIRTAWAKGIPERVVIFKHAAKNALIPVVTVIGGQLPMVIGGAVIIEQIFNLPGIGRLMLTALNQRDYPMISAINLFLSMGVLIINLFVDMTYGWLDPRISYR